MVSHITFNINMYYETQIQISEKIDNTLDPINEKTYYIESEYNMIFNEIFQITDKIHIVNNIQRSQILNILKKNKELYNNIKDIRLFLIFLTISIFLLFIEIILQMIYNK